MISTQNMHLLPDKSGMQSICKAISVLDAILSQEWEYRYYSYNSKWDKDEEFFEMRNGEGDQMLVLFPKDGCVINGFAHELYDYKNNLPSKDKLTEGLPEIFNDFIWGEPVKSTGTTFCIWTTGDNSWSNVQFTSKDGSDEMLYIFDGNPQTYIDWANDYFEVEIPLDAVSKVYQGDILTKEIVLSIVDELEDWEQLKSDLEEIGYPYNF